ncbi:MAG: cell filamentation protein Fic [Candidatus Microsaccharimonas sossegonensis]|uniref:Cell filamentation protein Fic n=1 Tax=Candidatus Microsaccharimonas sossegonensis TaxID=2506948 RepID=A0A4Q0AH61_9BACT|nr:MAG: cell filamentation protein Fic [Candidatus Microsaccharimonas sossegonensis]
MSLDGPVGEIILYVGDDGKPRIDVTFQGETVWLSQAQMVELYQSSKSNVSEHIKNIFVEGELDESATVRKFRTVQTEGGREVVREIEHYNLDMIISLGYRIKSSVATKFRIWATQRLREYIVKGFAMDDERLKEAGGGKYWIELLERIRDIRSSEKVLYRQVLDLFATSRDYDPHSPQQQEFFKIIQNKLHYAVNLLTAAEVIHSRVDSDKPFLGLTAFKGNHPTKAEASVAKNYLSAEELAVLNRLVSAFFDLAELKAINHESMNMSDWVTEVDRFADIYGKDLQVMLDDKIGNEEIIELQIDSKLTDHSSDKE